MERHRVGELVEEIADNHFSYLDRAWAPLLFKDEDKPASLTALPQGVKPGFLIHDRDSNFPAAFDAVFQCRRAGGDPNGVVGLPATNAVKEDRDQLAG